MTIFFVLLENNPYFFMKSDSLAEAIASFCADFKKTSDNDKHFTVFEVENNLVTTIEKYVHTEKIRKMTHYRFEELDKIVTQKDEILYLENIIYQRRTS